MGILGTKRRFLTRVLGTCAFVGVTSFDVNQEKQEVIVRGSASYEDVLATIKKTGKEVNARVLLWARNYHANTWSSQVRSGETIA